METLRLFIAIDCPPTPPLRRALGELEALRPGVTPVAAERLHLTLRFLGETAADRVEAIAAALDRAVASAGVGSFEMHLVGVGRFPAGGRRPPRVVYADIVDPAPLRALEAALPEPIPPAERPLSTHLTLARVKPPRRPRRPLRKPPRYQREQGGSAGPFEAIDRFLAAHARTDFGRVRVEAVHLYKSDLTPAGPIHTVQHTAALPEV